MRKLVSLVSTLRAHRFFLDFTIVLAKATEETSNASSPFVINELKAMRIVMRCPFLSFKPLTEYYMYILCEVLG